MQGGRALRHYGITRLIVRLVIFGVLAAGMFLAMRKIAERAGPVVRERGSEMFDRMLANMPESFPPSA